MTTLSLAAVAMLGLSSCSLINKNVDGNTAQQQYVPVEPKASTTSNSTLAKNMDGEWTIIQVGKVKVAVEEDIPYLTFSADEHRFYSSNGCNILNGGYTVDANNVKFSNVMATMKYCQGIPFEQGISDVLKDGVTVKAMIKKIGNESYMYFNDNNGKALMTLVRHNLQFLNGQWLVTAINGKHINDEEANVFIDMSSLKIHGNTGCNYFNGDILVNPNEANSISFSGMGVTRMACPKTDQERTMLVALEEAASVVRVNANTVAFANGAGKQVLTLTRTDKTRE